VWETAFLCPPHLAHHRFRITWSSPRLSAPEQGARIVGLEVRMVESAEEPFILGIMPLTEAKAAQTCFCWFAPDVPLPEPATSECSVMPESRSTLPHAQLGRRIQGPAPLSSLPTPHEEPRPSVPGDSGTLPSEICSVRRQLRTPTATRSTAFVRHENPVDGDWAISLNNFYARSRAQTFLRPPPTALLHSAVASVLRLHCQASRTKLSA
jgi:hypothetical protein